MADTDVSDDEVINAIALKIHSSNIDDPDAGHGTTRDQIHIGLEDSQHYARAALRGLKAKGYKVVKPDAK